MLVACTELVSRFKTTGSVWDIKRPGIPSIVRDEIALAEALKGGGVIYQTSLVIV